ncbi:MAG: hypothetical protein V4463_13425 [Pseudomonadota bacterium]
MRCRQENSIRALPFLVVACLCLVLPAGRAFTPDLPKELTLSVVEGTPGLTDGPTRVLLAAYRCLGVEVKVRGLPNLRGVAVAKDGQVDGDVVRLASYERTAPDLVRVPTPMVEQVVYAPFILRGQERDLSSLEKLASSGLRIGVRLGVQIIDGTPLSGHVAAMPTSYPAAFKMLLSDRLDIVLAPTDMWQSVQATLPSEFHEAAQRVVRLAPVLSLPAFHYLHARWGALVPVIDAQLQRMKNNGSSARLLKQDGKAQC